MPLRISSAHWKLAISVRILKPGRTDGSIPKNLRANTLLSGLGKSFKKVVTARLISAACLPRAIPAEHLHCLPACSTIDGLMMTLTSAQNWTSRKTSRNDPIVRHSVLTNDIQAAFNYIIHDCLTEILPQSGIPTQRVAILDFFQQAQTIAFRFDGKYEEPRRFRSSLPHSSPYSPILFVI